MQRSNQAQDLPNVPAYELNRSPAAQVVGRLAAESGLLLSHFEQRHHLPLPDAWIPHDRPDLQGDPRWEGGRLVEHKYRHFRYENPIGSFHPGHRAKWTAHELCHALVGFAWRPGATPFFQSLAARLAEVVPVALWYFFDEDGLRRCHRHKGPLFQTWCPACDEAAKAGPTDRDPSWLERGMAFVEGEITAVMDSATRGRSVGHRFATLDLESDALAHTAAHRLRMQSPQFTRYLDLFHGPHLGCWPDLETLAERARAVARAICGGDTVAPLAGRRACIAQDVGWRLMQVQMDCGGEVVGLLDTLIESLLDEPFQQVVEHYSALCEDFYLPPPEDVFAVGYPFAGYQAEMAQLEAGVESSLPETSTLIDIAEHLPDFIQEPAERTPIARRFARFVTGRIPQAVSDVARYEAALAHPAAPDREADAYGVRADPSQPMRVAEGVEVLDFSVDPRAIIAALALDTDPDIAETPTTLALRRTGPDLLVAEVSPEAAATLRGERSPQSLDPVELETLCDLGFLQPATWWLTR